MPLVKMAMAMREAAGQLIAAWRERGRDLGFGAGIAQGYATLGQIGFSERSGYTAIGTLCNVAARLCAEAKDGQILLGKCGHRAPILVLRTLGPRGWGRWFSYLVVLKSVRERPSIRPASQPACVLVSDQDSMNCGSSAGTIENPAKPRISAAHMAATTGVEGAAVAD